MPLPRVSLTSPVARGIVAAILLAAIAGGVLLARAASDDDGGADAVIFDPPTPVATSEPEAGIGPLDDRAPVQGQPAPDFVLRDLDGAPIRLSDLRGRVVFVNFWATWCRPCKKELPDIQRLSEEHPDDLAVLAINVDDPAGDAAAFFAENGLSMTVLLDKNGGVYDQYRLRGLPDSVFIDRAGNIAVLQYGYLTEEMMRDRLARAGLE